jgi:hypothetical protein
MYTKRTELFIADTLSIAFFVDKEYIFNTLQKHISQIDQLEWIPKIDESRFQQIKGMTNCDQFYKRLRGCSMTTSILLSQNFRFQITIYLVGNWDLFLGAHNSFSKEIVV